ncbi:MULTISPECIES: oxidoreductase [unclassified Paenibacillus]|uniref:oxidoreductase n=1 Tax=unclassified Paenibacillus TaxID=185978 RepID=UPI001AE289BB
MKAFKALVVDQSGNDVISGIRELTFEDLPSGELLIQVVYSSVNYKDALACIPNGNVIKSYPFIPGIDLAGIVKASTDDQFQEGDEVLITGYELGVSHFGGFSEYARVSSKWAVKLPQGLSAKEAMIFGTAGFTAALSVQELQDGNVSADQGPILVTGATGGVGSMAVAMLAKLGYEVVASTGKADQKEHLMKLGAARVISREELVPEKIRSLDKQLWAGAIDCVGGKSLSYILSSTRYGGAVAVSGLTGGTELATTVFPFILRGIRLVGIDSVMASMEKRVRIWGRLASELKPVMLDSMYTEIALEQIPDVVQSILKGQSQGRTLVKI